MLSIDDFLPSEERFAEVSVLGFLPILVYVEKRGGDKELRSGSKIPGKNREARDIYLP